MKELTIPEGIDGLLFDEMSIDCFISNFSNNYHRNFFNQISKHLYIFNIRNGKEFTRSGKELSEYFQEITIFLEQQKEVSCEELSFGYKVGLILIGKLKEEQQKLAGRREILEKCRELSKYFELRKDKEFDNSELKIILSSELDLLEDRNELLQEKLGFIRERVSNIIYINFKS